MKVTEIKNFQYSIPVLLQKDACDEREIGGKCGSYVPKRQGEDCLCNNLFYEEKCPLRK